MKKKLTREEWENLWIKENENNERTQKIRYLSEEKLKKKMTKEEWEDLRLDEMDEEEICEEMAYDAKLVKERLKRVKKVFR